MHISFSLSLCLAVSVCGCRGWGWVGRFVCVCAFAFAHYAPVYACALSLSSLSPIFVSVYVSVGRSVCRSVGRSVVCKLVCPSFPPSPPFCSVGGWASSEDANVTRPMLSGTGTFRGCVLSLRQPLRSGLMRLKVRAKMDGVRRLQHVSSIQGKAGLTRSCP